MEGERGASSRKQAGIRSWIEMKTYAWTDTDAIVQKLDEGGIVAFPTDTVYGVGVPYGNLDDLKRLKQAKRRPEEKPIPMMISDLRQIEQVAYVSPKTRRLIDAFMPGALTIVVRRKDSVDPAYTNGKDTIALRMPDLEPLLAVIRQIGRPLMVTSANMSGEPTALTYEDALSQLGHIDAIVQGTCRDLQASTIVDCTNDAFVILREGAIPEEKIREVL